MESQQPTSYQAAIEELQRIVAEMQSENCSIDNLSTYTARSLELLKVCKAKLTATDSELQKILKELDESVGA